MKLHLPKILFTAVLAACTMSTTAWAKGWGNTPGSHKPGESYFIDDALHTDEIRTSAKPDASTVYVASTDLARGKDVTISSIVADTNVSLVLTANPWASGDVYNSLLVESLTIGDGKNVGLSVVGGFPATISTITGKLNSINVAGGSSLTINCPLAFTSAAGLEQTETEIQHYSKDGGLTQSANGFAYCYHNTYYLSTGAGSLTLNENTVTIGGTICNVTTETGSGRLMAQYGEAVFGYGTSYHVNENESLAAGTAASYKLSDTATLTFTDTFIDTTKIDVIGGGRVEAKFHTTNHNPALQLGELFTGTLAITSGNMKLDAFQMGEGAKLALNSGGQVWSSGNMTFARDILLEATELDSAVEFAFNNITLSGMVTGSYLRVTKHANALADTTLTLTNANNDIEAIKVEGRQLDIQAGHVGLVNIVGGSATISGGTVDAVSVGAEGTLKLNATGQGALLAAATGSGRIEVAKDTLLSGDSTTAVTPAFTGTIAVTANTLTIGSATSEGENLLWKVDLSNNILELNGGNITYYGGNSTLGTVNVKADGKLHLHATTHANNRAAALTVNKVDVDAEKTLTVDGTWGFNVEFKQVTGEGTVQLNKPSQNEAYAITVGQLDGLGKLVVNDDGVTLGASTHTVGTLNLASGKTLNMAEGAVLNQIGATVTGKKDAKITNKGGEATDVSIWDADSTSTITNATIEVTSTTGTDRHLRAEFVDSAIKNSSTEILVLTNGASTFTDIDAAAGRINLQNRAAATTVGNLNVGSGLSVTAQTSNGAWTSTSNAVIQVSKSATFGEGANLYAGLTLADGASLTLNGALTMHGGTLTLGSNITLDSTTLASITGLADGDTTVTLFTGVGNLTLSGPALQSETEQYTLNQIFAGEGLENFYLSYSDGNVYAGKVVVAPTPGIPEPATATLSLLALAGLAARRRRK